MSQIKVYHNPSFLSYQGNHAQIPLINQLVATVTISDELNAPQALDIAFAQTQHLDAPCFPFEMLNETLKGHRVEAIVLVLSS